MSQSLSLETRDLTRFRELQTSLQNSGCFHKHIYQNYWGSPRLRSEQPHSPITAPPLLPQQALILQQICSEGWHRVLAEDFFQTKATWSHTCGSTHGTSGAVSPAWYMIREAKASAFSIYQIH